MIQALFQALIGTVETSSPTSNEVRGKPVSSPHRYCRNEARDKLAGIWDEMFQALIGTVETRVPRVETLVRLAFQALIGTVETRGKYCARITGIRFQALIGTVETLRGCGGRSGPGGFKPS